MIGWLTAMVAVVGGGAVLGSLYGAYRYRAHKGPKYLFIIAAAIWLCILIDGLLTLGGSR